MGNAEYMGTANIHMPGTLRPKTLPWPQDTHPKVRQSSSDATVLAQCPSCGCPHFRWWYRVNQHQFGHSIWPRGRRTAFMCDCSLSVNESHLRCIGVAWLHALPTTQAPVS